MTDKTKQTSMIISIVKKIKKQTNNFLLPADASVRKRNSSQKCIRNPVNYLR